MLIEDDNDVEGLENSGAIREEVRTLSMTSIEPTKKHQTIFFLIFSFFIFLFLYFSHFSIFYFFYFFII